jgi:hypothetical protein
VEVVPRNTLLAPPCDRLQTAAGAGLSHVETRIAAGRLGGNPAVGLQVEINE